MWGSRDTENSFAQAAPPRLSAPLRSVNLCTPGAGAIGLVAALTLPVARVMRVDQLPLRTTDALKLWRTQALRFRLGRRGQEVAIARFTVEHMVNRYERLWHKLVTAPQVPRLRVPRPRE